MNERTEHDGAELWARLDAAPRHRVRDIQAVTRSPSRNPVPANAHGVYGWYREDEGTAVYIGSTPIRHLRQRLANHFAKGPDMSSSSLRRNVCFDLGGPDTDITRVHGHEVDPETVHTVNEWLSECFLAWIVAPTGTESEAMETAMLAHRTPRVNRLKGPRRPRQS